MFVRSFRPSQKNCCCFFHKARDDDEPFGCPSLYRFKRRHSRINSRSFRNSVVVPVVLVVVVSSAAVADGGDVGVIVTGLLVVVALLAAAVVVIVEEDGVDTTICLIKISFRSSGDNRKE